jgi:predicted metal-dependent hydrolase
MAGVEMVFGNRGGPLVDSLVIEGLTFTLRWSPRRRTIGITVRPDGGLVVAAPAGCRLRRVETVVREKLPWVRRKLAEVAARPAPPGRVYADGERLPYLGSSYRLCLVENGGLPVRFYRGRFLMEPDAAADGRRHMIDWYARRAETVLVARVDHFSPVVGAVPVSVQIRDLGRRWGTCDAHGRLRFHWETVLFPDKMLDYVVVHELAHLHELNHSPRFWSRVERVVPDYRERKKWLRENASAFAL